MSERSKTIAIVAAILYHPASHNGSPASLSSLERREEAARDEAVTKARDFIARAEAEGGAIP